MTRFPKRRPTLVGLTVWGAAIAAACTPAVPRLPGAPPTDIPARLRVQVEGRVSTVSLEQYVLGAALSEVTPVNESNAAAATIYEVQAVVARTYAVAHVGRHGTQGFDLCDTTHCQLYQPGRIQTSRFAAIARSAVVATTGRVRRFEGRPASTPFHSDCGGRTTTASSVWGGAGVSYLQERDDNLPNGTHRTWQFSATAHEWSAVLSRDPRTDAGGTLRNLLVSKTDSSGRAAEVEIVGARTRRVSGATLRAVVSAVRGDRSVLSTRFVVSRTDDGFRLDGTGFGHGVGLCQVGAMARARRGDSAAAILAHYFPGTR